MGTWTLRLVLAALVVLTPAAARPAAAEELSIRLAGQPLDSSARPIRSGFSRAPGAARVKPAGARAESSASILGTDVCSRRSRSAALTRSRSARAASTHWTSGATPCTGSTPQTLRTTASLRLTLPFEVVPGDDAFLPFDLAVGRNALWVSTARGALARVNLRVDRVLAMVRLPGKTTGEIAVGANAVWVAESLLGVYRVDPGANRVSARIRIGPRAGRFAVDRPLVAGGKVFAVGSRTRGDVLTGRRGLARVDPARNRLKAVTPLPSGPLAVAFGKGSLWSAVVGGSSVERIEAGTGKVVSRFRTDDVSALAVAGGDVWTATRDRTIRRLAAP